jgi:hypothetical protein
MGNGMGMDNSGNGKGGIGNGKGGDDSNSGPKGKLKPTDNVVKAPSNMGKSGMVFSAGETTGAPDSASAGNVPYTDVLPDYKKAAESALSKEKVPPAYRNRVKDYFSSLEK